MSLGLIGQKIGMTRIFADNGDTIAVTVIDVSGNRVTQLKKLESDNYLAVQLAFGTRRASRVSKALAGHYAKAGVEAASVLKEFRLNKEEELTSIEIGSSIKSSIFRVGQKVDVTGITIGKGYAGAIKLHNFSSNRASHGNSKAHRKPGSIGMAQDPGRIFPGKRMSGHMGNVKRTIQNLEVVKVDIDRDLLLIKGAIPGAKGGKVFVYSSVKKRIAE